MVVKDQLALAIAKRLPFAVREWCVMLVVTELKMSEEYRTKKTDEITVNDLLRWMDSPRESR